RPTVHPRPPRRGGRPGRRPPPGPGGPGGPCRPAPASRSAGPTSWRPRSAGRTSWGSLQPGGDGAPSNLLLRIEQDLAALVAEGPLVLDPPRDPLLQPAAALDRLPRLRAAGEEIDRRAIGDELVGGLAPGEAVRPEAVDGGEQLDAGAVGLEGAAVGQQQLDAAADFPAVFLELRPEVGGDEGDSRQLAAVELVGQTPGLDERRARELERPRGAPPLGELGRLD